MANHVSALKRAKQSEVRRVRNKGYRTKVRNAVKAVRLAVESKDLEQANVALRNAISVIDKVSGKGVVHYRTASRYIARLSAQVNSIAA